MAYTSFIFESFRLDPTKKQIALIYRFADGPQFTETISLPANTPMDRADTPDVQRALLALHLAGGVSYYKAFCPPRIEVTSGHLSAEQAKFWNEFYTKGLGEFFYQNKLDFHGLINFPASTDAPAALAATTPANPPQRVLVPFGGGKDSQVTIELLKKHDIDATLFRMKGHKFITELAELNKLPLVEVDRALDPGLFELNKQGALNGHIPITGYVVFLTLVVALLYGHDGIVLSNERSSDYGNVEYLGMQVNHQWSKSNEAELLMRHYIEHFITTQNQYLNLLRPLSELHIAKLFSLQPQYFAHITSCNQNWLWQKLDEMPEQQRWCGECDKCAFVFAIMAAFLPMKTVVKMFGKNVFDDATRTSQYRQLWGAVDFKPFQCVGTPEETKAALYLATRQPDYAGTAIGKTFISEILPSISDPEKLVNDVLTPDYTDVQPYIAGLIQQELAA